MAITIPENLIPDTKILARPLSARYHIAAVDSSAVNPRAIIAYCDWFGCVVHCYPAASHQTSWWPVTVGYFGKVEVKGCREPRSSKQCFGGSNLDCLPRLTQVFPQRGPRTWAKRLVESKPVPVGNQADTRKLGPTSPTTIHNHSWVPGEGEAPVRLPALCAGKQGKTQKGRLGGKPKWQSSEDRTQNRPKTPK